MKDHWTTTSIGGVFRAGTIFHSDDRGSFGELWRESWTTGLDVDFVQANLSVSRPGVLRGLHFHRRQVDLWVLLEGLAQVALVDVRNADAGGEVSSLTFDFTAGDAVLIPTGVAHGFLALEAVKLLYLVSNEYDGSDEHGFAWNDSRAGVKWRIQEPILSARDASAPTLSMLREGMPRG